MATFEPRTDPAGPPRGGLPLPASVDPRRINWSYALNVLVYHLLALLAFLPGFFSWTGVAVAFAGTYVFGVLGINIGYHRLLTHRGFTCPKWFEHMLALLGVCCLQDSPARWVASHRRHHHHADEREDPHSPLAGFFWGHVGWLLVENPDLGRLGAYDSYAKDLIRDPFYKRLERFYFVFALIPWPVFFLAGFLGALVAGDTAAAALQAGTGILLWGVAVRVVWVWHATWSVNSLGHLWGYRNYATDEASRNNWIAAIVANGEGWHNNHHADSRSALHGHRWWEIDVTWLIIRLLAGLGLVHQLALPRPRLAIAGRPVAIITHTAEIPGEG